MASYSNPEGSRRVELFWVVCGSCEILLVDRESVQSGVLTQAIVGQLEQLPLLKINANDCGIVKWRETVGLQTPSNARESRECMGSPTFSFVKPVQGS